MKTIKFRAWDKEHKAMIAQSFMSVEIFLNRFEIVDLEGFYVPGEFELMQFTGLHDKNGKEIYEGDILTLWRSLSVSGEPRGEYYTPLPVVYEPLWCQFVVEDKENKEYYRIWQDFDAFEVVGNLWENPELL